jgi:hypothetical protein
MKFSTAAACFFLLFVVGCGATIVPPARPVNPVPVFVTDYGRHSSLVLPDGAGDLVEFAYGDWNWFAVNKTGFYNALSAMLWSGGATFGVRHLDAGPQRANLAGVIGCNSLLRFDAEASRVEELREKLSHRMDAHLDTIVFNPASSFSFVRDDEHYAIWHNCNHVTARWLTDLGCRIEGEPATSKFKLAISPH